MRNLRIMTVKIYLIIYIAIFLFSPTTSAEEHVLGNSVFNSSYNHSVIDYGQVVYGSLIVFTVLGVLIFLLKKSRLNIYGKHDLFEVINSLSLSTKEKLIIIRVGREYLLIGVSNAGISKLHVLNPSDIENLNTSGKSLQSSFTNIYATTVSNT